MSSPFTTVQQVAAAVAAELRLPPPRHPRDFPRGLSARHGMGYSGTPLGIEPRYWVRLPDGRDFWGSKASLFEWAGLNLSPVKEEA